MERSVSYSIYLPKINTYRNSADNFTASLLTAQEKQVDYCNLLTIKEPTCHFAWEQI